MSKHKYRKCSQCGESLAHWYSEDLFHKYYCDDCISSVTCIDNVRNLDDFGEPLIGSNVMWWDISCISSDFVKRGSLLRGSKSFYYAYLDDNNNRIVSNRFKHSLDGFLIHDSENVLLVNYYDLVHCFNQFSILYLSSAEIFKLKNIVGECFMKYRFGLDNSFIEYNKVMSQLGDYIRLFSSSMFNSDNHIQKFFNSYRIELKKYSFIGSILK